MPCGYGEQSEKGCPIYMKVLILFTSYLLGLVGIKKQAEHGCPSPKS